MSVDWHERFAQQAGWTHDLRRYLYQRASLAQVQRVLEVGCGTGVILSEIHQLSTAEVYGVDLDRSRLRESGMQATQAMLLQADGQTLPFPGACFGITLCHFLLLWVKEPQRVINEMRRVTRPGGAVLALAEPDYGGRIDYPDSLSFLGKLQQASLESQGADPRIGRKLRGFFVQAGFKNVETGILGAQWKASPSRSELDLEWTVLQADLKEQVNEEELEKIRSQENDAWEQGERVLFVPTFYAWGQA